MGGAKHGQPEHDLGRIHDDHATAMFHHGMALLRDQTAVRDVLQDVFLKLAQGRVRLDDPAAERAYLLRMVHHASLDRLRRMKVRQTHAARQTEDRGGGDAEMFQRCPDPDREAFRLQMESALAQLPEEQRIVVVLKLWEEHTFEQIAAICGIPANTAASRYRYALDKLRALLRPVYEDL
ncbi:MAG: sigW 4 [Akkermansiaceae bacterium]|nr:sigW 4 [Akkermansiaceae bacterium]